MSTGLASSVEDCTVTNNLADGVKALGGSSVSRVTARLNGSSGIELTDSGQISGCTVTTNGGDGITVVNNSLVVGNLCVNTTGQVGIGIHITGSHNRIDSNQVTRFATGVGIDDDGVNAVSNLVIRNSAIDNSTGFVLRPANGNKGDVISDATSTEPWANFGFQ